MSAYDEYSYGYENAAPQHNVSGPEKDCVCTHLLVSTEQWCACGARTAQKFVHIIFVWDVRPLHMASALVARGHGTRQCTFEGIVQSRKHLDFYLCAHAC